MYICFLVIRPTRIVPSDWWKLSHMVNFRCALYMSLGWLLSTGRCLAANHGTYIMSHGKQAWYLI